MLMVLFLLKLVMSCTSSHLHGGALQVLSEGGLELAMHVMRVTKSPTLRSRATKTIFNLCWNMKACRRRGP